MSCPFSSYYSANKNGEKCSGNSSGQASSTSPKISEQCRRKTSIPAKLNETAKIQHQSSFSVSTNLNSSFQRDESQCKFSKRADIAWERGPSLEQLKGPNGIGGVVQQRVHSFSQYMNKSAGEGHGDNKGCIGGINRSISTTFTTPHSDEFREGRRALQRPLKIKAGDDRPLLRNPKKPIDPEAPLVLKNLVEAVWSFITIPVSIADWCRYRALSSIFPLVLFLVFQLVFTVIFIVIFFPSKTLFLSLNTRNSDAKVCFESYLEECPLVLNINHS